MGGRAVCSGAPTLVRVKGTAGKAEEAGRSLAVQSHTAPVWALFWRCLVVQGLYV